MLMSITVKEYLGADLKRLASQPAYENYCIVREAVYAMLDSVTEKHAASDYWQQELEGMLYLLDASPLVVDKWRHHTYHVTGLYEYFYRRHHAYKSAGFQQKLGLLKGLGYPDLCVPESPQLGGFGYEIDGALFNLDTLKFYEVLIGLERAGFLKPIREKEHPVVLEVGAGWGGFAYQFKTLFPHSTYVVVDLPQTILISATYLKTLFPAAKIYLGDGSPQSYNIEFSQYDFVFIPHFAWPSLQPHSLDLAFNMVSFQEMTDSQVQGYVKQLADWKCPRLYSLNRDRSPNNQEISSVSTLISNFYNVSEMSVLPIPYHTLALPTQTLKLRLKKLIKNLIGYKSRRLSRDYRHLRAVLSQD